MRVMGIDYGERRIGVALSDPTGTIASPLPTLKKRRGKRPPYGTLEEIAEEHGVEALVMGLPLSSAGAETEWTNEVRRVGDKLADRLRVPVHYVDERMTSARARRVVRGRLGLSREQREEKERIDAAAAVLILQSWLDRPGSSNPSSPGPSSPSSDAEGKSEEPGDGSTSDRESA